MLQSDKDGFITGGIPVDSIRRTRTDNLLYDIRGDVRAIRKAVAAGEVASARRAGRGPSMGGARQISSGGSRAVDDAMPAVPISGIKGGAASRRSGRSAAVKRMPVAAAGVGVDLALGGKAASGVGRNRERRNQEVVAAGSRDSRGRFVAGSSGPGLAGVGGGISPGEGEGRLASVADRLAQAVGGLEDVGEADPAVRAMQEIADPISRAYGALRGDKDARRQDGWFKKILKRLKGIEDKSGEPVVIEQGGVFAMLGRFIPMLLPVLAGLAATVAAMAAYFKIEGYVSDGEKAKEGADAIKRDIADPVKELLKPAVDTDKRAAEERARVLESRDGEYGKEEALKLRFVSPTGAAQGSKAWNDEFYRFSQAELARQEAEAKRGLLGRSVDSVKAGAKAVSGKVGERFEAAKGAILRASARAGTDPGIVAQIAHFESGFNPDAAPIAKDAAKNRVRIFDGRMALSSAHGLGQFTDATWLETLRKHGGKHGVENASKLTTEQAAKLRGDVELQAAMLAELTRENVSRGRALGGNDDAANVYALHNLGEGDGAKFLKALSANPGMSVRDALMQGVTSAKGRARVESVIANNRSLYGDGSMPLSQAYAGMGRKMAAGAKFADSARTASARGPVNVSVPVPPAGSMPSIPSVPEAPKVSIPLASSEADRPAVVVALRGDPDRRPGERGIAHVVIGGMSGGAW